MATALHSPLLEAILSLVPDQSQLWIATHSIGFVRKAYDVMKRSGDVVFLGFLGHNFDQDLVLVPRIPDCVFWQNTYQVALDDISGLIAPEKIILCEGSQSSREQGFDAACYKLFADIHPDALFVSRGGSTEVERSEDLIGILHSVVKGTRVWRLIDRDDMTPDARQEKIEAGVWVLNRREIENYLYDLDVVAKFLGTIGEELFTDSILKMQAELLSKSEAPDNNVKAIGQELFEYILQTTRRSDLGNTREQFAKQYLVPALKETSSVIEELRADVFPSS